MRIHDNITFGGITKPVIEWAAEYDIPARIIILRITRGWSVERAVTTPMRAKRRWRLPTGVAGWSANGAPLYAYNGEAKTLPQWCAALGIPYSTLNRRLARGMSFEEAVTTPKWCSRNHRPVTRYTFAGESLTLREWSDRSGISYYTLRGRLRIGWSIEEALSHPVRKRSTHPGVDQNFEGSVGTGAGGVAREISELEFSE